MRELGGYLPKSGSDGAKTWTQVSWLPIQCSFPLGCISLEKVSSGLAWTCRYDTKFILLVHNHRIREVIEFVLCLQAGQTRNHSWHMQIHLVCRYTRRRDFTSVYRNIRDMKKSSLSSSQPIACSWEKGKASLKLHFIPLRNAKKTLMQYRFVTKCQDFWELQIGKAGIILFWNYQRWEEQSFNRNTLVKFINKEVNSFLWTVNPGVVYGPFPAFVWSSSKERIIYIFNSWKIKILCGTWKWCEIQMSSSISEVFPILLCIVCVMLMLGWQSCVISTRDLKHWLSGPL